MRRPHHGTRPRDALLDAPVRRGRRGGRHRGWIGAAAFAAGAPVPRPIRAVAHDVGLPVDSPELTDAKGAESDLRIVLAINDPATIKRVRARLNHKLAAVPRDERGQIEKDAKALLARADQQLRTADDATSPATGSATPKIGKGATELVGSMSGSGSTKAPSGSTGTGGALDGRFRGRRVGLRPGRGIASEFAPAAPTEWINRIAASGIAVGATSREPAGRRRAGRRRAGPRKVRGTPKNGEGATRTLSSVFAGHA